MDTTSNDTEGRPWLDADLESVSQLTEPDVIHEVRRGQALRRRLQRRATVNPPDRWVDGWSDEIPFPPPRPFAADIARPRASHRIGWSVAFAALANLVLFLVSVSTGTSNVGLVASAALAVVSLVLVLAEVAQRYGQEPESALDLDDRPQ